MCITIPASLLLLCTHTVGLQSACLIPQVAHKTRMSVYILQQSPASVIVKDD